MTLHAGTIAGATSVATAAFPLIGTSGSAVAPTYSVRSGTYGLYSENSSTVDFSISGTRKHAFSTNAYFILDDTATIQFGASQDAIIARDAAQVVAIKNADTAQSFRVYGATTGPKYVSVRHDGTNAIIDTSTSSGYLNLGTNATTVNVQGTGGLSVVAPQITAGSGTGFTLNDAGSVRKVTYKCTTTFAAYAAAATTGDKVICVLPAKTRLISCYADTTTKYIGGNISATTLRLGISAGGVEVIASHDVFTAAVTKGLADADMGTSMTRAAQIQGAYTPSFTANTTLTARITTTSNNTNVLTQGSTTWYLETELLP